MNPALLVNRHPCAVRAAMISFLTFGMLFLISTGVSDLPRALAFSGSFAVWFVLVVKSSVDVLVLLLAFASKYIGMSLGYSYKLCRRSARLA